MRDLPARVDVLDADAVELAPFGEPPVLNPKAERLRDVHQEAVLGGAGGRLGWGCREHCRR